MNKDYILKLLQKVRPGAELPTDLGNEYDETTKSLTLSVKGKGLKANMQEDKAAFDSWSIALKYYLEDYVSKICIDREKDFEDSKHYNRFVYRLAKFVHTYPWAQSAKPIPEIPSVLYCN